jgi:hypothetical protein
VLPERPWRFVEVSKRFDVRGVNIAESYRCTMIRLGNRVFANEAARSDAVHCATPTLEPRVSA